MVWFLLLLMATACSACVNNLHDLVFTFPRGNVADFVKVDLSIHSFSAATVCLRAKTDLHRDHALFALSTTSQSDTFVIFWDESEKRFIVEINGHDVFFKGFDYEPNKWHSICATWDSSTGLVQLWIDGHSSVRKCGSESTFSGPCIVLGQEPDGYCSHFDAHQSFVGLLTDVYMWDYVLNPCEIRSYLDYQSICPGNAVNWNDLSFHTNGKVLVQDRPYCSQDQLLQRILSKNTLSSYSHSHGSSSSSGGPSGRSS